jgi:hypothetical protein
MAFNKPRLIFIMVYIMDKFKNLGNFYEYELGASIWAFSANGSAVKAV